MQKFSISIILLIGIGMAQITVSPSAIDTSVSLGQSIGENIIVTNNGSAAVTLAVSTTDQTVQRNLPPLPAVTSDASRQLSIGEPDITYSNALGQEIPGIRCATPQPSAADNALVEYEIERWLESHGYDREPRDQVNILVAFHVIYNSSGTGNVPDEQIAAQIQVFNDAYNPYGIHFTLDIITRTENNAWFSNMDGLESTYKAALAVDPVHYFNIYTGQPSGGILGWAYLPSSWPENSYMHGVVLLYNTLPGGSGAPYNQGDTGTHEAGHYLGLRHTFLNGCANPGDYVDDTPFQSDGNNIFSCNESLDTCPQEGLDPVHNFMNYTDDACITEFTPLQGERMWAQINTYRPGLLENPIGVQWVTLATDTLTIPAMSADTLTLTLNSSDLMPGTYLADLELTDTSGVMAPVIIPITFSVFSVPTYFNDDAMVDFGISYTGYPDSTQIHIRNLGAGELALYDFSYSDTLFSLAVSDTVVIPGYGSDFIQCYYTPLAPGLINDTLRFATNDPNQSLVTLPVNGTVLSPPVVDIPGDTLRFLTDNASGLIRDITLKNTGASDLNFTTFVSVDVWSSSIVIDEDFSDCSFPVGWSDISTSSQGWQVGDDGSSAGFAIPAGNGCYAYYNDDAANDNGMEVMLVSPDLDFYGASSIFLFFRSYFSGENNQTAEIRISTDGGSTWETIMDLQPFGNWRTSFISLNAYSGFHNVRLAFFTSDNGGQGSGFAVDEILVNGSFMQSWLDVTPGTGTVTAGDSVTLSLQAVTDGLELGMYNGELIVLSNDPAHPETAIPVTLDITVLGTDKTEGIPQQFTVSENYPNPFNPQTRVDYQLPQAGHVHIQVYTITGQTVLSEKINDLGPGNYSWTWNGRTNGNHYAGTGMYFLRMSFENTSGFQGTFTRKMILLK
ncbi:MAG: M43 family zinc metalloprotease [Fidelibacterota bacterium]